MDVALMCAEATFNGIHAIADKFFPKKISADAALLITTSLQVVFMVCGCVVD